MFLFLLCSYANNVPPLDLSTAGGGFTPVLACRKLLEEAYSCLLYTVSNSDQIQPKSTHAQ